MMNIVYVCCRCCCFVLLQLEDLEVTGADYVKPSPVGNFRAVWEELPPESEREDDYGLGHRDNLQVWPLSLHHACTSFSSCLPVRGSTPDDVNYCDCNCSC